ncbi:rhomboid family intramembrane serine protease [Weeksellaceae bacterium TAE3-ERU29]|nr:rhomboid family intramembrane serine protease [Weeksellaceae bacterium TAE3-ERU29]
MEQYITYIIIGITVFVSWQAWQNFNLFERLKFQMSAIVDGKQYDRMFTSAFVHADWMHLFFNMFVLYTFMPVLLSIFSAQMCVLIYIAAILSGSLFTILFHRKDKWYSAVGASGGVSGIVFSAIMLYPDLPLTIIFFPFFSFPGWAFGLIYLGYSLFGMKNNVGNLGHAAHLGGSIAGILLTALLVPASVFQINIIFLIGIIVMIIAMGIMAYKENVRR